MNVNEIMEMDYYFGNGWLKEFAYRKLFVRYEKDAKSSIVTVLNDGYYVGSYQSKANTKEEFINECEAVRLVRDERGYRLEFKEA